MKFGLEMDGGTKGAKLFFTLAPNCSGKALDLFHMCIWHCANGQQTKKLTQRPFKKKREREKKLLEDGGTFYHVQRCRISPPPVGQSDNDVVLPAGVRDNTPVNPTPVLTARGAQLNSCQGCQGKSLWRRSLLFFQRAPAQIKVTTLQHQHCGHWCRQTCSCFLFLSQSKPSTQLLPCFCLKKIWLVLTYFDQLKVIWVRAFRLGLARNIDLKF